LFFILSGFILSHAYPAEEGRVRGGRYAFYIARVARVYPVYLFALLLAVVPYTWRPEARTAGVMIVLLAGLLMQAWIPFGATLVNPPAWSLSVEAVFYLLFPVLGPAVSRLTPRHLGALLVAAWMMALLPPLICVVISPPPGVEVTYWLQVLGMNPLVRLPEFVMGLALGRLYLLGFRPPSMVLQLGPPLCVCGLALALAMPSSLVHNGLLDPLFALAIYALACGVGRTSCVLASRPLQILGEGSYAVYLLQWPLWDWLTHFIGVPPSAPPTVFDVPLTLAYLILLMSVSVLTFRFIEQPARSTIRWALIRG
jgi:peptidoglycan/LPS O-acetylase OafA/YrhL